MNHSKLLVSLVSVFLLFSVLCGCSGGSVVNSEPTPVPPAEETLPPEPTVAAQSNYDDSAEFSFPDLPNEKPGRDMTKDESNALFQIAMGLMTLFDDWNDDSTELEIKKLTRLLDDNTFRIDLKIESFGFLAAQAIGGGGSEPWEKGVDFIRGLSTVTYEDVLVDSGMEGYSVHIVLWNDIDTSPYEILLETWNETITYNCVDEIG